ncbi:MAG: PilN domain-containing protein [Bdellovibrionota bacterium]
MIKINLATRKQAALSMETKAAGGSALSFDINSIKDLPWRKIAVPLIAAIAINWVFNGYKEEELKKKDEIIAKLSAERGVLVDKAGKIKGYEEMKKAIEADESVIRTKIDIIRELVADRGRPPRMLLSVSNSVPKNVWLSELKIASKDVIFKGTSLDFTEISDFMKNLGETAYYTDVSLSNSQKTNEENSGEAASFEVSAKGR